MTIARLPRAVSAAIRRRRTAASALSAVLSALLAFATVPAPSSATSPPRTAADSLGPAEAFVAAVNDSSSEARRALLDDIFAASTLRDTPDAKLLSMLDRLHRDYAPLEVHHCETPGRALHLFARTRGGTQWRDFQFFIEPAPPNRILQLAFIAEVAEPVYLPNGSIESPETLAWVNGYIDKLVREEDLAGALLVAKGDQILFQRHFGFQDLARATPVAASTRFNLGSGNKMFTALAILSLADAGRLRLEDPISTYLPDFPDPALARRITIRHLLSHSSGLGDYWTKEFEQNGWRSTRVAEFVPFAYSEFKANGPHFAPGAGHRYSNSGFLLLGRIVENVTGEDYYEFIRKRIYAPLGMKDTDHYLTDGSAPGLAEPLNRAAAAGSDSAKAAPAPAPGAHRWRKARHGLRGTPAGGGFSTTVDMLRFARGLVTGRIVGAATLATMVEPQPPLGGDEPGAYGLGFLLQSSRAGMRSFGHGGIAGGVNFELRYFPSEDITLIAFSNQDNGAYDDLRKNCIRLVTGDR